MSPAVRWGISVRNSACSPLPLPRQEPLIADRDGKAPDQRQALARLAVGAIAQAGSVMTLRSTLGKMPGNRILTRAVARTAPCR